MSRVLALRAFAPRIGTDEGRDPTERRDPEAPDVGPTSPDGLEASLWGRHRRARVAVVLLVVPVALLLPALRSAPLVGALVAYILVCLLVASLPRQPRPLGGIWWLTVASDCSALGLILAVVPEAEAVAFLGLLLVVIVNGTTFGARAGVATATLAALTATAAHIGGDVGDSSVEMAVDLGALILVVILATYIVGRQTEELRNRRRDLERALFELRRVDEVRRGLVSALAHDVRSPLGGILGAVQTVLRLDDRLEPEDRTELLRRAERQTLRLLRLAEGLLDLARAEDGRLELDLRSVRLHRVVVDALSYLDPRGRVRVEVDPALCVRADPERLEQIVINLAGNMLKHGSSPFIVSAGERGGQVELAFVDSGPGIPGDAVGALFEPFRRGGATGSVGLGLWIVRMLAEAHGGSVRYEPARPAGACFRVTLPRVGCGSGAAPDGGRPTEVGFPASPPASPRT